jgi:hypothetical protein
MKAPEIPGLSLSEQEYRLEREHANNPDVPVASHRRSCIGEGVGAVVAELVSVDSGNERRILSAGFAVVEHVKELSAQGKAHALVNLERTGDVHIPLLISGADE